MDNTGRPIRIDWPALLDRIGAAGKTPAALCLFCLPEAGRQLLLAMAERLQWRATYRVEGYDYSDWDELQDFVEQTIGELAMPGCDDIIASIVTQVTNNVQTIVTQANYYTDACCYLDTQPANTPPPSETDPPENQTERDNLCIQAQIGHDGVTEFLEQVFLYAEAGGGLTAAVIALFLGPIGLALALVAIIIGFIVAFVADDITDDVLLSWENMKHDIVCAIVNATSAAEAKAAVDDVIEAAEPGVIGDFFKTLFSQAAINQIWNGELPDPGGYQSSYCDDCSEWVNIGGIAVDILTEDGNKFGGVISMANSYNANNIAIDLNEANTYPLTICIVDTGLSAYFIGDNNTEGGFDGTPLQSWLNIGCHSGDHGPGFQSIAFSNFKLLVSTSENPNTWYWVTAQLANADGYGNVAGEFIVDEGSGIVGFIDIPFNGNGEFYYKPVAVTPP